MWRREPRSRRALARRAWDLVITGYVIPGFSGASVLRTVREHDADLPLLVVSGMPGEDLAVAAMKQGAHDYIMKSDLRRLAPAARRALLEASARRERTKADRAQRVPGLPRQPHRPAESAVAGGQAEAIGRSGSPRPSTDVAARGGSRRFQGDQRHARS